MKQLRVSAIKNGTVLDHIPSQHVFKLVELLEAKGSAHEVLIGHNLHSNKLGKKGIIKLSDIFLSQRTLDAVSLLAAGATIITIKNYEIAKKETLLSPSEVRGVVSCFNPNCITNAEKVETIFQVMSKKKLYLECHYCEKVMYEEDITFC